ncbi:MAG: PASTA domain-containing protein [Coriobacteriia bacterium]|nr:PASTA domain-containing protein [Coriobacteriia bacterium]
MAKPSSPLSPTMVPAGSRVIMVVSEGATKAALGPFVEVPDVTGRPQGAALRALQDCGLSTRVINDYSETVPRGRVINQLPGGGLSAAANEEVKLLVSSGPSPAGQGWVELPDVTGKNEFEAISVLEAARLSPQVMYEGSSSVPLGSVIAQLPDRTSLLYGSRKAGALKWLPWAAVGFALAVLVAVLGFTLFARGEKVPSVVGMTQAEAVSVITKAGFIAKVELTGSTGGEVPDTVVKQKPWGGGRAKRGTVVVITVVSAEGEVTVRIPDVHGMTKAEAIKELQAAGLLAAVVSQQSDEAPVGSVVSQEPAADSEVPKGSTVTLAIAISASSAEIAVPAVVGIISEDAISSLKKAGFVAVVVDNPSFDVVDGVVVSQLPVAGSKAAKGSSVVIIVSLGAPEDARTIDVPRIVGFSAPDAQKALREAGLECELVDVKDGAGDLGKVYAQVPTPGAKVSPGSTVVALVTQK